MIKLFETHNLLHRVYTQNIDTLERIAGIDSDLIVEAHGSFAENHCIKCSAEMSTDVIKQHMAKQFNSDGIPKCHQCNGLVKPDITFFGEGLPSRFFDMWDEDCENVDIAIVAGTSLAVYPFASLPTEVETSALRVLINQEAVGDFATGRRKTDILLLDDCDVIAEKLVHQLGWEDEFLQLIKKYEESTKTKDESVDKVNSQDKSTNTKTETKTEVGADVETLSKIDDSKPHSETQDKLPVQDGQNNESETSTDEDLNNIDNAITDLKI
jgi:NAD-dependent histone deacetylase SIR2